MARAHMGDIWEQTTEFAGEALSALAPVALLTMILPGIASAAITATLAPQGGAAALTGQVLVLGLALLSYWGQFAIAAMAIPSLAARRPTQVATARLLPGIGVGLLLALIAAAILLLPLFLVATAYGVDLSAMMAQGSAGQNQIDATRPGMVQVGLAFLVLLVVIVALGVRMAPLTGVVLAERRAAGAIGRAWALTRGLTWKLVGVAILYGVAAWVAGLATQAAFGLGFAFVFERLSPAWVIATAAPAAIVSAVFTVLATVFCALLYVRLADQPAGEPGLAEARAIDPAL